MSYLMAELFNVVNSTEIGNWFLFVSIFPMAAMYLYVAWNVTRYYARRSS